MAALQMSPTSRGRHAMLEIIVLALGGASKAIWNANYRTFLPTEMPMIKKIRHITRKRKNRNFAIPAAANAMPVNPNKAATSGITRKITAQRNILNTSSDYYAAAPESARLIEHVC